MDDREYFTKEDAPFWPIYIHRGGEPYSFCPAKAGHDIEAVSIFKLLILAAETGNINLNVGGINDQPDWWIENLSWFVPRYKQIKFVSRVKMIFGDGSPTIPKLAKQAKNTR